MQNIGFSKSLMSFIFGVLSKKSSVCYIFTILKYTYAFTSHQQLHAEYIIKYASQYEYNTPSPISYKEEKSSSCRCGTIPTATFYKFSDELRNDKSTRRLEKTFTLNFRSSKKPPLYKPTS